MGQCRHLSQFILVAVLLATLVSIASTVQAAEPPVAEYKRPELVAITWHDAARGRGNDVRPVWRPDGTMLDQEEVKWLRQELQLFDLNPVNLNERNYPLNLIFRIDERAKTPQYLMVNYRKDGKSTPSGGADYSGKNFLTHSALAPRKTEMSEWGPDVDFEVRVPIGELEVIKRIEPVPAAEIHVDKGVRWYVELRGEPRQPTAVLEITRAEAGPLSDYFVDIRLKNGDSLKEGFRKYSGNFPPLNELKVSRPISESNPIVSVEFQRRRHRMELYEKIPTHLELKPMAP